MSTEAGSGSQQQQWTWIQHDTSNTKCLPVTENQIINRHGQTRPRAATSRVAASPAPHTPSLTQLAIAGSFARWR
ncbi:hypothetical protein IAQ61_010251 [Plenodomus lingam]|uniref:uncharacterized protein n=1 Tax=Leptosphaeria maculans TaxID=5022 RepID=UPI00331D415A|nr:hypothetical protein IAQ61_010251 [Plenodomus lingam]